MREGEREKELDNLLTLMQYIDGRLDLLESIVRDESPARNQLEQVVQVLSGLPLREVSVCVKGVMDDESNSSLRQLQPEGLSYKQERVDRAQDRPRAHTGH